MGRARYAALRGELGQAERFVRLAGTSDSGSPQRLLRDSLTLVWKNAGADLQPVVADARRRLGRLMKGEKR